MKFLKILWERLVLEATLPKIKLALSSKSRDLLSHVISECMQMRGRIKLTVWFLEVTFCGLVYLLSGS